MSITGGQITFCAELIGATRDGIDWSEQEATGILTKLQEWWDADKEFIKPQIDTSRFYNISDEFKNRFENLVKILVAIVIPSLSAESPFKKNIKQLLEELSEYGIPCVAADALSLSLFSEREQIIMKKIKQAIFSKQEEKMSDGYDAIYQICKLNKEKNINILSPIIWSYISSPIKWRNFDSINNALILAIRIINDFSEELREGFLNDISFGLDHLIRETSIHNQESEIEISERLDVRARSALLACKLYKYYLTKSLKIPISLEKWKSLCGDINEFADIRHQWEDCV